MGNLLFKIAESKVKQDKNGKNYKVVEFAGTKIIDHPVFGKLSVEEKPRAITRYEESYLDDKAETGYNSPIFDKSKPVNGGFFEGQIVTRDVEVYEIDGREVETYTTVVFGDTDSPNWETLVKRTFKSQGHPLIEKEEASTIFTMSESEVITEEPVI